MLRRLLPLLLIASPALAEELSVKKTKDKLEILYGQDVVTTYHMGESVAKPYFWPVNAPDNKPVTRAWPMIKGTAGETTDHVHQKSAWFCHGDVIPVGLELKAKSSDKHVQGVDFWSENTGHGKIVCVSVGEPVIDSKTRVHIPTKNEWRTADGVKILDESRTIVITKLDAGYLISLEIELTASVCDIRFGDTKEGSMGIRVPDAFRVSLKDGGTITSSNGKVEKPGSKDNLSIWGLTADWHDYSGKVGSDTAGIAVFDASTNTHRACWHTRAYGLMAANPFARDKSGFPGQKGKTELVTLTKGDKLSLRYGIYSHTGDASSGKVADAFKAFSK